MINSSGIGSSTSSHTNAGRPPGRITPLRQRSTEHLVLQQKAKRTVQSHASWIYDLAKFHHRSPDQLGQPEMRSWILHLITERNLSASSINLAINALRAFYHGMLGQDIESYFAGIKRPARKLQPPRVFSFEEIERLITVGTEGDPFARVFLMTVFGCGLRLSEATHVQVSDIDAPRMQLRVSHPKGGRHRVMILSPVLLQELRQWYRVHRPVRLLFSQEETKGQVRMALS